MKDLLNLAFFTYISHQSFKMNTQKPMEKTREQSIAEFDARTRKIQQEHPDVDFKSTVIEPTMNLMFDIKVRLSLIMHELS